jgi:formylglycine-generating enzyme required for sulfatase activity
MRNRLSIFIGSSFIAALLFSDTALAQQPGQIFRDCSDCPEMVVVPAGGFMMGADKNFENASDDETPLHRVNIERPFALGKYEVTQGEWVAVMGDNPSNFKGRSRPVEQVSWNDAQDFIRRLNAKTGKQYRLPSEAEWEYAARAGSQSTYSFGDEKGQLGGYAWFDGNSGSETHPVGQLKPNRFGLYDMHGNVWEWVQDCWNKDYRGAPDDGRAWTAGDCGRRVLRGGSWLYSPFDLRARGRYDGDSGYHGGHSGFPVARTPP